MESNKQFALYTTADGKKVYDDAFQALIEADKLLYTRPEDLPLPAGYLDTKDCPWYVRLIRYIF